MAQPEHVGFSTNMVGHIRALFTVMTVTSQGRSKGQNAHRPSNRSQIQWLSVWLERYAFDD